MLNKCQKKGQASLIVGLVFSIASLIIAVIISFVIVQTLTGADLLNTGRTSATIYNESVNPVSAGVYLARYIIPATYSCDTITSVYNATNNVLISAGNYTQTGCLLANTTSDALYPRTGWKVTYPYTIKTNEELSSEALSGNMSKGINNVSAKIPTVLLVASIVLILGVLVLLVGAWQRMRLGGGVGI